MKKLLLIFSLLITLFFNQSSIIEATPIEISYKNGDCSNPSESIVRIINNYDIFNGNGVVYKTYENFTYIIK